MIKKSHLYICLPILMSCQLKATEDSDQQIVPLGPNATPLTVLPALEKMDSTDRLLTELSHHLYALQGENPAL
ncbi:MAG: hypothetical protein Q8K36_01050, partial [Alphaproteobacteria bacterium]|nr:hypothetical protein [Alphaproteobacteria bacterium]